MKLKHLLTIAALIAGAGTAWAQTDVTSTYITNADFSSTTGWTAVTNTSTINSGNGVIGEYKPTGSIAATVDGTHLGTEYCLGFSARWNTAVASYTQETSSALPVGLYELSYDVEDVNASSTKISYQNLFYVQVGDIKYYDQKTEWMNAGASGWTSHSIVFYIDEAKKVTFSVGYGNNENVNTTPTLYVSHLKLTKYEAPEDYANALTQQYTLTGATSVDVSDFIPQDGDFTIQGTGAAGEQISINNLNLTYTPTESSTIRFVKKDAAVFVFEGDQYMATLAPQKQANSFVDITSENVTSSASNLLGNPSFETLGTSVGTNIYNIGTPWSSNVTMKSGGIRVGTNADAASGSYVLVWRGSGNNNYFSQEQSSLKANRTYQVKLQQVASGNSNANFNIGIGASAGGYELASTTLKLGTNNDGVKTTTFTTPSTIVNGNTYYFTFKNTSSNSASSGNDPVTQIDWISLVCQNPFPVTGLADANYLEGSAYAPVKISEIRALFNETYASISSLLENATYTNVTGSERTALVTAKDDTYSGFTSEDPVDYENAIAAINDLKATFMAAKSSYDAYAAEKANADRISTTIASGIAAPTSASNCDAVIKSILVAEYNYVSDTNNFNADAAATYGITIDQWTGTATSGGNADTPQTNSNEKWGTTATTYYEQGKNGWGSSAWTLNYTKTVTLPANTYVLKVAARASAGTTATLKATIGGTTITESLPNVGSNGKGITTAGVASFDEGEFARDGEGYGWQWRYLAFTLENEGEVTLQIDASANSKEQWCSFGDVAVVSNVTTDAMETAYNNFTMQTLGFEDGQYAPYNNVDVLEAYAQAKAIVEGTAVPSTQAEVDAITTTLTSPTWTANAGDVDAIYNGSFSSTVDGDWGLTAWTRTNAWGQQQTGLSGNYATAYYNQPGSLQYGNQGVYTMPLKGNQVYKLTVAYHSHEDNSNNALTISVLNNDDGLTATNVGWNKSKTNWKVVTMFFKTGESGNYVLSLTNDGNTWMTGVSLVKAEASETVLCAMPANYTYYQELTLNRTFSADKWNTLCAPFAFDKSNFAAVKVLSSVAEVAGDVNMTFADADDTVAAGTPCLVKAANNGDGLTVANVTLDPAALTPAGSAEATVGSTTVTYQGTYSSVALTSANSNAWVVSNNNLYNVDSEVTVGAYRAYFTVETSGAVKALNFNFDAVDAIEAIDNGQLTLDNAEIYNLAGQRVNKAQRGIYIVNGKKVLVK